MSESFSRPPALLVSSQLDLDQFQTYRSYLSHHLELVSIFFVIYTNDSYWDLMLPMYAHKDIQ